MNHQGTKTLQTERLILRRFRQDDAEAVYRNWASDPQVTAYLTWKPHASVQASAAVIADWIAAYEDPSFYQWAIELRSSGEPVGSICASVQNADRGILEIGYCLGTAWWHRGIMSEAFAAVIDYLFAEVSADRIEARHDKNNPRSGGVMKNCGLTHEGTLRQVGFNNCGVSDDCVYGILRSEWESRRAL